MVNTISFRRIPSGQSCGMGALGGTLTWLEVKGLVVKKSEKLVSLDLEIKGGDEDLMRAN